MSNYGNGINRNLDVEDFIWPVVLNECLYALGNEDEVDGTVTKLDHYQECVHKLPPYHAVIPEIILRGAQLKYIVTFQKNSVQGVIHSLSLLLIIIGRPCHVVYKLNT